MNKGLEKSYAGFGGISLDPHVVLHTSLSGSFNKAMVEKVGCNDFLSKFQPDDLAAVVQKRLREYLKK